MPRTTTSSSRHPPPPPPPPHPSASNFRRGRVDPFPAGGDVARARMTVTPTIAMSHRGNNHNNHSINNGKKNTVIADLPHAHATTPPPRPSRRRPTIVVPPTLPRPPPKVDVTTINANVPSHVAVERGGRTTTTTTNARRARRVPWWSPSRPRRRCRRTRPPSTWTSTT